MSTFVALCSALVLAATAAAGDPSGAAVPGSASEQELDARSFCTYARSAAESESALLVAPEVVGSFGWLHETESVFGERTGDKLRPRLMLGLRYSLGGLWRGVIASRAAGAQCRLYELASALRRFAVNGPGGSTRRALAAKAEVLRAGLPEAESILQRVEAAARDRSAPVSELTATQLRVDALRADLAATEQALAALPAEGAPVDLGSLVERLGPTEDDAERLAGKLRQARAWDVSVQGGYDRAFGIEERLPWYALLSASFDLGFFWQRSADERAIAARRPWAEHEANGAPERARAALREMRAAREVERGRAAQSAVLLQDLEGRYEAVRNIRTEPVARYRDYLWFDVVKARAEHAYLDAHVKDLSAVIDRAQAL